MHTFLLALHVLFAIFAVGPLVGAAMATPRALRNRDPAAMTWTARLLRLYALASVLVVAIGFALMPTGKQPAHIGDVWIWVSALLWAATAVLVLAVLAPALDERARSTTTDEPAAGFGRIAAMAGMVPLVFTVIVFLMVYQP